MTFFTLAMAFRFLFTATFVTITFRLFLATTLITITFRFFLATTFVTILTFASTSSEH
ncbi:Protein of unknown function [Bacillus mycoides]|nr:Protein of unknown function [Bacillus mycoides]